jgi:hypothetical protein
MSDNSRDKRLGSGTKLLDAVQALDKVGKDHRAEYLHDRLMSAIDSICEERQGTSVKPLFSAPQLDIIKDVSFHIVYILHHKPDKKPGMAATIWKDYCGQGPIKMISIGFGVVTFFAVAFGFVIVQVQNYRVGGVDAVWASFFTPKEPVPKSALPALSTPTSSGPRAPTMTRPTTPPLPLSSAGNPTQP